MALADSPTCLRGGWAAKDRGGDESGGERGSAQGVGDRGGGESGGRGGGEGVLPTGWDDPRSVPAYGEVDCCNKDEGSHYVPMEGTVALMRCGCM